MAMSSAAPLDAAAPPRPLRRLSIELFLLVLVKIALLALIWWLAFAPHPKPDASPASIEHLLAPSASPSQGTRP